jgi:cytochrome c-type biogenesis protein CcmE
MSKNKNKKFIIGGIVVLIAAVILGYAGYKSSMTYYYNIGAFQDKETALTGQTIRVSGIVDPNVPIAKDGLTYHFTLLDTTNSDIKLSVVYNGATPPEAFKSGQQAVVEGKYDAASGAFKGTSIVVKCASKQPAT